jgi:putative FmdB family regulatory protein
MPIYEYRCAKCGEFDVMQRITEKPLRKCPTCKGKVEKLVSNTSFHLKGSGWYVTDYAGKGKDKAESGASAKDSAKDSAKADASTAGSESTSGSEKPGKGGGKGAAKSSADAA